MICRIFDPKEFEPLLSELLHDPNYSDPHLHTKENLYRLDNWLHERNDYFFGVWEGSTMTGLFDFMVLEQDHFVEMVVGLSRSASAYREMLDFVRACWTGFQADFVFNPCNDLIKGQLAARGAAFDTVQHRMVLVEPKLEVDCAGIELLSEERFPEYAAIHRKDVYWTAERVIAAPDRFRVFLAIEHGHVVGYLDVTIKFEENEVYCVYVQEASRQRGWEQKLLAKAIEWNRPNGLIEFADADNDPEIQLFQSAGFVVDPQGSTQVATWMIP